MMLRAWRPNGRAQTTVRTIYTLRAAQRMEITSSSWLVVQLKPATVTLGCFYPQNFSTKPVASSECLQLALARTRSVSEVLNVWEAHRGSVYSHNVVRSCLYYSLKAAEAQQLSSARLFEVPRFDRFWSHLLDEVPGMSANTAIKCLYNCAQFGFNHNPLSLSLVDICSQKPEQIPSVSIGILLWSLKRLNLLSLTSTRSLLTHLLHIIHSKLVSGERFKPQSLANILWVLATSGHLSGAIANSVTATLPRYINEFDFHSLSLCLWSLTTSGAVLPKPLLQSAGHAAGRFLETEKSVPNTLHCCWAFASAEFYHKQFCEALSRLIQGEPADSPLLTPRLLSSAAWMCAAVGYFHPPLLDCIASRALGALRNFNTQDLGNLMYAYTQLDYPHLRLVREVTERFMSDGTLLADEDACVSIAWANLATGQYPLNLLEHLMEPRRVRRVIETGDQNSLNFLLRLQVLLAAEKPSLGLSLPHQASVQARVLAQSRWYHPHSRLLSSILYALSDITGSDSYFTLEALTTTLHFIDIEIILDDRGHPIPVPNHWRCWEDLQSLVDSPLLARNSPSFKSLLQDQVSRRVVTEPSGNQKFSLASDWGELVGGTVEGGAVRVAVEVDGPWHYAANCRHTLGKTLWKHRILRCLGWTVVSIPYFEWQELGTKRAQVEFLRTKIFTTHR